MPSVTRRPQANRQERRERFERQLLDATDRLMADGASFTELSVDRLATEAGVSRAPVYLNFEANGPQLRGLTGPVFADLAAAADRWWSVSERRDPSDVRAAMSALVASYRHHQPLLVALNEMAAYDPLVGATYTGILNDIAARLAEVIEGGQRDGAIRSALPAAATASTLTWMVERTCQQNLPSRPASYDAELTDVLTEIVWATLYLESP